MAKLTLTKAKATAICQLIEEKGLKFSDACRRLNIKPDTGRRWLARGEGRIPDQKPTKLLAEFADMVRRAEARFIEDRIEAVIEGGRGGQVIREVTRTMRDGTTIKEVTKTAPDWRADFALLQASHPDKYGRVTRASGAGSSGEGADEHPTVAAARKMAEKRQGKGKGKGAKK